MWGYVQLKTEVFNHMLVNRPIAHPRDSDTVVRIIGGMMFGRGKHTFIIIYRPPQIQHGLCWDRNLDLLMWWQRLIVWELTRILFSQLGNRDQFSPRVKLETEIIREDEGSSKFYLYTNLVGKYLSIYSMLKSTSDKIIGLEGMNKARNKLTIFDSM
jgi:hypothetical protein